MTSACFSGTSVDWSFVMISVIYVANLVHVAILLGSQFIGVTCALFFIFRREECVRVTPCARMAQGVARPGGEDVSGSASEIGHAFIHRAQVLSVYARGLHAPLPRVRALFVSDSCSVFATRLALCAARVLIRIPRVSSDVTGAGAQSTQIITVTNCAVAWGTRSCR